MRTVPLSAKVKSEVSPVRYPVAGILEVRIPVMGVAVPSWQKVQFFPSPGDPV
ncbi:MAG: hypothetical protein K0B15_12465 [Lentimicrobium sp.]|nr:hypothetical protein [Lentimicrobium sp.]